MLTHEEIRYQSYWEGFLAVMEERYPYYAQRQASKEPYQVVPPTWFSDGIRIAAGINRKYNSIRVDVTLISQPNELAKELTMQKFRIT